MKKIDAVIVVEGKNDMHRLRQVIDADMICTYGLSMPKEVLDTIVEVSKTREIIIFTDPDSPGNRIRHKIQELIPNASNLYLQTKQAKGRNKVGIEHARLEDILEAFSYLSEGKTTAETLTWEEYLDLGLSGMVDSKQRRLIVAEAFHIGEANAKTFYHRLNMAHKTYKEIEEVLQDEKSNRNDF